MTKSFAFIVIELNCFKVHRFVTFPTLSLSELQLVLQDSILKNALHILITNENSSLHEKGLALQSQGISQRVVYYPLGL